MDKKENTEENNTNNLIDELFGLNEKKKKKKKKQNETDVFIFNNENLYNYHFLLNRICNNIKLKNDCQHQNKIILKAPKTIKLHSRKIAWTNFYDICDSLNRNYEYIYKYTLNELNSLGSIDKNKYFIIRGNHNQKIIEDILRKYVLDYVQCNNCACLNTNIEKGLGRIHILTCNMCRSTKNILI